MHWCEANNAKSLKITQKVTKKKRKQKTTTTKQIKIKNIYWRKYERATSGKRREENCILLHKTQTHIHTHTDNVACINTSALQEQIKTVSAPSVKVAQRTKSNANLPLTPFSHFPIFLLHQCVLFLRCSASSQCRSFELGIFPSPWSVSWSQVRVAAKFR